MNESYSYLIKFLLMFLGIFAIIFVISLLTPKMAKIVDKVIEAVFKKNPERVDDDIYKVRSIYDASPRINKKQESENKIENGDVENGKE